MTGSTHDPKDPSAVARVCYISAMVYAAFIAFCGCQVSFFGFGVGNLVPKGDADYFLMRS